MVVKSLKSLKFSPETVLFSDIHTDLLSVLFFYIVLFDSTIYTVLTLALWIT